MGQSAKRRRSAFTLTEMLVVIVIIALLAALLVPAVMKVVALTETTHIAVELGQLHAAMEQYKLHHGSYPPNSNPVATAEESLLRAHVKQKFANGHFTIPYGMDAGESLVFWLQGYTNNPLDPLGSARESLMQFDATRLKPTRVVDGIPLYHYCPPNGQGQPYIYIHSASYDSLKFIPTAPGAGVAQAYRSSVAPHGFVNPETFQIISAGRDGDYGAFHASKQFPGGLNYSSGDRDNVTNFSGGALQSKME